MQVRKQLDIQTANFSSFLQAFPIICVEGLHLEFITKAEKLFAFVRKLNTWLNFFSLLKLIFLDVKVLKLIRAKGFINCLFYFSWDPELELK